MYTRLLYTMTVRKVLNQTIYLDHPRDALFHILSEFSFCITAVGLSDGRF